MPQTIQQCDTQEEANQEMSNTHKSDHPVRTFIQRIKPESEINTVCSNIITYSNEALSP